MTKETHITGAVYPPVAFELAYQRSVAKAAEIDEGIEQHLRRLAVERAGPFCTDIEAAVERERIRTRGPQNLRYPGSPWGNPPTREWPEKGERLVDAAV